MVEPTGPVGPFGWSAPVRGVLGAASLALAVGLLVLSRGQASDPAAPLAPLVVDPNTASPEVLSALPRIGPVLASRIVEERGRRPFVSVEDLDARVRGIGPATLTALRPHLRIAAADEPPSHPSAP